MNIDYVDRLIDEGIVLKLVSSSSRLDSISKSRCSSSSSICLT